MATKQRGSGALARPRALCSLAMLLVCLAIVSASAAPKRPRPSGAGASGGGGGSSSRGYKSSGSSRDRSDDRYPDRIDRSESRAPSAGSGGGGRRGGQRSAAPPPQAYGAPSSSSASRRSGGGGGGAAAGRRGAMPPRRAVDEDEEYEYEERRGYGRGAVVPSRRQPSKQPRSGVWGGLMNVVMTRAASVQEDTKGKVLEWRKIAKGKFSSTFERFMLQLTWPDDTPVDETFLQDLIHYMDRQDDYPSEFDKNNPYRRTLRKLWARMCEKDWRTVAKSLYLVHAMARDLSPPSGSRVRKHIQTMRKELDPKSPSNRYFQMALVVDVSPVGEPFRPLLKEYATFAFRRVVAFEGGMEKIEALLKSPKTSEAAAVTALASIDGLICQGVRCKIEKKGQLNPVTKSVVQMTSADLMDLWRLLTLGVSQLCRGRYSKAQPARMEDAEALLNKLPFTQAALSTYLESFRKFVKDRSAFDERPIDAASIAAYLYNSGATSSEQSPDTHSRVPPKSHSPVSSAAAGKHSAAAEDVEVEVEEEEEEENDDVAAENDEECEEDEEEIEEGVAEVDEAEEELEDDEEALDEVAPTRGEVYDDEEDEYAEEDEEQEAVEGDEPEYDSYEDNEQGY